MSLKYATLRARLGQEFGELEHRTMPATGAPALVGSFATNSVLDTKLVAYDATVTGSLSFNLSTGGYSANVQLPAGVKLDTSALKALMSGSFAVPKVDPVQAVTSLAGLKTSVSSNYEQVRAGLVQKYGGGNVYLSTQRFSDWASPENVANTIGAAVLTGGSTAGQVIQEAKDVLLGELGNLYTWLRNKAPAEADATIAAIFKGMVTKKDVDTPFVALKFQTINQTYTVNGGTIANWLGAGAASKTLTVPHLGFAVVWKGPGDGLASLNDSMNKFPGATLAGKDAFAQLVSRLANRPELKGLGKVADAVLGSNPAAAVDQLVATKLKAALGLTPAQLKQLYQSGNPVIDLRATQLDENLAGLLAKLKIGNEGSVQVTRLTFDVNTYEVNAEVSVRARHSWGSLGSLAKYLREEAGKSFTEVARILTKEVGAGLADVAAALRNDLKASFGDVANALRAGASAGYTEIARVLKANLGAGFADIAGALSTAGAKFNEAAYAMWNGASAKLTDIASALWTRTSATRSQIASALWNAGIGGFYQKDVAYALAKGTGAGLTDIAGALWNGISGITRANVASALWNAGIGGFYQTDVAYALAKGTGAGITSMAEAL